MSLINTNPWVLCKKNVQNKLPNKEKNKSVQISTTLITTKKTAQKKDCQILIYQINDWVPDISFIHNTYLITKIKDNIKEWSNKTFYLYLKNIEEMALIEFKETINKIHTNDGDQDQTFNMLNKLNDRWVYLALLRDFHDFMCGRDVKHYIRTDDCRRFIKCVINGMYYNTTFAKPVYRLLEGDYAPKKFKHKRFLIFN
jgi:hypothetical protein